MLGKKDKQEEEIHRFPREKVLTMDARVWIDSQGKKPSDFDYVGVYHFNMEDFLGLIPQGAVIVCDYIPPGAGTALIPKTH